MKVQKPPTIGPEGGAGDSGAAQDDLDRIIYTDRPNVEEGEEWVRITRHASRGPFQWHIQIGYGIWSWSSSYGGWFARTEAGARKKAERKLVEMRRWRAMQKTIEYRP